MVRVYDVDEAKAFFLRNSKDIVCCVDGQRERVVDCYPDAYNFFNKMGDSYESGTNICKSR